ncbi:MAG: ATP-binding protein [Marinospirillum sp.]|uniref:AAA family ATPase n=1 Tax=Marinospirillum sp. TaxID=2183934 RepID=UPI0019E1D8CA|nr:AAA family ATPase [Marinospirillum sp.]MBE0506484.1 ATP-binding protein [Marinospirillum sp.]
MRETLLELEGVKGVGKVSLNLLKEQKAYAFIGANGIGKTKTLEALFQLEFFNHKQVIAMKEVLRDLTFSFSSFKWNNSFSIEVPEGVLFSNCLGDKANSFPHDDPVVFLGSQNRGFVHHQNQPAKELGSLQERRTRYLKAVIEGMQKNFTSLNMGDGIENWFVSLAQSANRFQKKEDNREVEIETLLKLLHQIDQRIDPGFLEIDGDGRVSLKIEGKKRQLAHLSSGFASVLKLLQAIVSGYGYFTNETQLQQVKGRVFIDEIESHLHLGWQAGILPLLKKLFPNTTFYVTTHSSIVLTQLKEGEAYRLERDEQGVVRNRLIQQPNKSALIDVLKDAFELDINQLKLDNLTAEDQQEAKSQLLKLVKQSKEA